MSSSSHLSKQLQELIKSIGQTKSKQQEDRIIENQLTTLKPKLGQKNLSPKKLKQLLIRALYIEMLGHSASFAHIHALNLTQSKNLTLKRIGYLLCSLFMNKDSELLIMLVSTIQKDLNSTDVHQIVICLTSLGNLMNQTIAQAIRESVLKLLSHSTDLVRKKAIGVMQKMQSVSGNVISDYKERMKKALCDRQPSVMAGCLNLYIEEIKANPRKYKQLMPSFVIILKQVIEHKLPKEFDYHRMPAPWVQIKLLKIVQLLGKNDQKNSDHCYAILEQTLKRAQDINNNIAFAITYQCVRCIAMIYPNQKLIEEAANSLAKFMTSNSNNQKFMGIHALAQLYKQSPQLLNDYQMTIIDCLQSKDQTLKKETLDLLYKMTTPENIQITVSKMLDTLHASTDNHFRNALVAKITQLAQRFAPNHQWYLQTMQLLFELGSQYLNDQVLNNFLKLVVENYSQNRQFGAEIVQKMVSLQEKIVPTDFILKVANWIIGQIGSSYYANDPEKIAQLSSIVIKKFECDFQSKNTRVWLLDAVIKLATTKDFKEHMQVKLLLEKCSKDKNIEIYQRALQSKRLAKYNVALKKQYQVNLEEDLGFLDGYVQNALKNGAKKYQHNRVRQTFETKLRLQEYKPTSKPIHSSFPFQQEKQQEKPQRGISGPKQQQVQSVSSNSPVIVPLSKPKKPLITPQQKAKKNLANALFGGVTNPKGSGTKAVGPVGPTSNKKNPTQNADLI